MSRINNLAAIGFVAMLLWLAGFVFQDALAQRPESDSKRGTIHIVSDAEEVATESPADGLSVISMSEDDGIVQYRPMTFFRDGKLFVRLGKADPQRVMETVRSVYRDFEDLTVTVEPGSKDISVDASFPVAEQVANLIRTLDAAAVDIDGNLKPYRVVDRDSAASLLGDERRTLITPIHPAGVGSGLGRKTFHVVELGPEFQEQERDKDHKRYIWEVYELEHANPFEVRAILLKRFPEGVASQVKDGKLWLSLSEPRLQKLAVQPLIESLEKAAEQRDLAEKQRYAAEQLRFEQEVKSLKTNIERLQAQYERMRKESGEKHPEVLAVQAAVELLKQKMTQATKSRERELAAAAVERQKTEASQREAAQIDRSSRGLFSRRRQNDDTDLEEAEPNQARRLSDLNRLSRLMTDVERKLLEGKLEQLTLLKSYGSKHPEVRQLEEITKLLQKELQSLEAERAKLQEAESSLDRTETDAEAALADFDLPNKSNAVANSVLNDSGKSFKDRLSRLRTAIENLKAAGLESEAKQLAIKAEQMAAQEAERLAKQKLADAQAARRRQVEADRQRENASRQAGGEVLQIVRELREEVRALRRDVNQIQEILKKSQQQAGASFGFDNADSLANSERVMFGVGVDSDAGITGTIVLDESQFDWSRDAEADSDDAATDAGDDSAESSLDEAGGAANSVERINVNGIPENAAGIIEAEGSGGILLFGSPSKDRGANTRDEN